MSNRNLAITYEPKIAAVISSTCTQTIRAGHRFRFGDRVHLHTWTGKPYRSPWGWRRDTVLFDVLDVVLYAEGVSFNEDRKNDGGLFHFVPWRNLDDIAAKDGIDPATGEELHRVLKSKRPGRLRGAEYPRVESGRGEPAQILRWPGWSECTRLAHRGRV